MNAYEVLKDHVVTGYDRCSDCGMTSTGIPTHILLSNQIYDLKCEIQRQNERIKELQHTQQQTLDRCQEVIVGEIRRLPDLLRDNLLENFQFENVAPVNIEILDGLLKIITQCYSAKSVIRFKKLPLWLEWEIRMVNRTQILKMQVIGM